MDGETHGGTSSIGGALAARVGLGRIASDFQSFPVIVNRYRMSGLDSFQFVNTANSTFRSA
jgi:hypothetical protein